MGREKIIDLCSIDFAKRGMNYENGVLVLEDEIQFPDTSAIEARRVPEGELYVGFQPPIAECVNYCTILGGIKETTAGTLYAMSHIPPGYEQIAATTGEKSLEEHMQAILDVSDTTFCVRGQDRTLRFPGQQITTGATRSVEIREDKLRIHTLDKITEFLLE